MVEALMGGRMRDWFWGYARPNGSVGVRNHVLALGVSGLAAASARRIAGLVSGAVAIATPYGRSQIGHEAELHARQLVGLGRNPNAGAVLVVGGDRRATETIASRIAETGKPVEVACLEDAGEDALALTCEGVRRAARLVRACSASRREKVPLAALVVGVECGHSDATSAIAANRLVGAVVDRLVDGGAAVIFGETLEWLGAEHVLRRRARSPEIGDAIVEAVAARERHVASQGVDLIGNNPAAENIRGGLSTIEEKSLGAVVKSGTRPIDGLLRHAEPPPRAGLYAMDQPHFSPISLAGFAAAGAQLALFTTGLGNSYVDALAPTIKISARQEAAQRLPLQIDVDASGLLGGALGLDDAAEVVLTHLTDVASGLMTWGEILNEGGFALAHAGPSL